MKKYILLLGGLALLSLSSCDEELTRKPFAGISEDQLYSTPDGFKNAVNGIYAGFIDNGTDNVNDYYGSDLFSVPDILADNLILNQNGRQTKRTLNDWLYNANGYSGFDLFSDGYKIVRKSNSVINRINNLTDGEFKNDILGQALAARGLAHFDLVRTYGKIPTQSADANGAQGVAYVTVVDPAQLPSRINVGEVYNNIVDDLTRARDLIADVTENGRFNRNMVNALLSRVYLYMGEWQKSIDAANQVTTGVCTLNNFGKVWLDETDEGIISQFLVRLEDGVAIGTEYSQTSPTSGVRSEYVVAYDFYRLYNDNDVRKTAYFSTSAFGGEMYNHIAKYFGKSGQTNNMVNAKIIRAAEVFLNKAEALAELNQDARALEALDAVRSQRYTGFVSGGETGQSLKDAIALERRLELAFEGHRFYDIKRKGVDVDRHTTFGDLADGTGTPATFKKLEAGDHRFQLPIPQDAINSNPNLKQNEGY